MCQRALSEGGVDITHQHFTHDQHVAHTSTAIFSTSVVVPVFLVSQCLCSHSVAQTACLSVAQGKERFHRPPLTECTATVYRSTSLPVTVPTP